MNKMQTYDPNVESKKTLDTMAYNFDNGYDKDPSQDAVNSFEQTRINIIEWNYKKTFSNKELENVTRKLISQQPEIQQAIKDATLFHQNQYRKVDNIPYIEHPIAVGKILSRITTETPIIQAWLLHDVIEDVQNGRALLEEKYPQEVISLVNSVSEQDKSLSWKERKIWYLNHLWHASYETLLISLADRIHNLRTMIEAFEKYGSNLRKNFNAGWEEQKWFLLSYSLKISEAITKFQDPKQKSNLNSLYQEIKTLIAYFIETGESISNKNTYD